jgi:hypothetical protein
MLEPDQWDAALSRITGTVYRGTERISSNALLNLLEVGPDPVTRQKVAKRPGPLSQLPTFLCCIGHRKTCQPPRPRQGSTRRGRTHIWEEQDLRPPAPDATASFELPALERIGRDADQRSDLLSAHAAELGQQRNQRAGQYCAEFDDEFPLSTRARGKAALATLNRGDAPRPTCCCLSMAFTGDADRSIKQQ